ncbi:MAG: AbrB/MazE/SpoVT family DNA-binding domain-containing protein [Deltaproteobacteria bacterium]|nr:AbrB/MazE/SpoVT family DNA-binding domain-containing protein [Deltaproteobacteria bacterium]
MQRKICHIGNSQGVSIPKEMLEKLHLSIGAEVDVELDNEGQRIIIVPRVKESSYKGIDKEFACQVNDFIEEYRPALKKLAE